MTTKDQIEIAKLYLEYNLNQNNQPSKHPINQPSDRYNQIKKIYDTIDKLIDQLMKLGVTQKVTFIGEDFLASLMEELDYKIGPEEYEAHLNNNPELKKKYEELDGQFPNYGDE